MDRRCPVAVGQGVAARVLGGTAASDRVAPDSTGIGRPPPDARHPAEDILESAPESETNRNNYQTEKHMLPRTPWKRGDVIKTLFEQPMNQTRGQHLVVT